MPSVTTYNLGPIHVRIDKNNHSTLFRFGDYGMKLSGYNFA